MIISRTPFRISFFGGGTDYPSWYKNHNGAVLATTINKYCYLTVRYLPPFFGNKYRLVYSKIENCQNLEDIEHPSAREIIRYLGIEEGLEIHHDGDLPARSGLGSSSAFTVGLLHALYALKGQMPNKTRLAKESIHLEQEILKETVGSQDQVLAAHGGFHKIHFNLDGEIYVQPMTLPSERTWELNDHLMLFYSGLPRIASNVAKSYVNNIDNQRRQLRIMQDLVEEAISVLGSSKDINLFGELLNEGWQLKRTLSSSVTNSFIDEVYEQALKSGATGGKLIGAGGGGFILLFVPPAFQKRVREKLNKLIYVPFKFESQGSQIIFYDDQEDYSFELKQGLGNGKLQKGKNPKAPIPSKNRLPVIK